MDEVEVKTKKIETEVNQGKMDYINYAYNEEIIYWKEAALARVLNESEEKELIDLAPSRVLLIRKEKSENNFLLKMKKSQGLLLMVLQPKSLPLKQ